MPTQSHTEGVYGPGSYADNQFVPLSKDCPRLLKHLATITPGFTNDPKSLDEVEFLGNDLPILPGPIKAQALTAVIQAMIGIVAKEIAAMRGNDAGKIRIDMDQAGMYPASTSLVAISGKTITDMAKDGTLSNMGTNLDKGALSSTYMAYRSWAIYPTRDKNTWYQILSNLAPEHYLKAFDLDVHAPVKSKEEAYELIKSEITKYSARELEQKNMELGACGQTCLSPTAWRETLMGKSLDRHPLVNYVRTPFGYSIPPVPFPTVAGDLRPLAGIKVVELARVIAGPALGAILTSLGAEVVKVESPDLPDPNPLQMTLTAGKWTCPLDLNQEEDRKRLHALLQDADVVIQAFRRRSLERKGFGLDAILEMAQKRNKGIVYLDLTCYGPDGTYSERPGYQQIADAASGCCYVMGKAYGYDEGVGILPSLPIADMVTGAVGALDVLLALRDRATKGGSYHADVALTAINTIQLTEEFGLYPPEVVKRIQETYKFDPMTPDQHVADLLFAIVSAWAAQTDLIKRKHFFVRFEDSPFGKDHVILGPIVKFENESITPYWKHSPVPYCYHKEVQWQS